MKTIALIVVFLSSISFAEYRVFKLIINKKSAPTNVESDKSKIIPPPQPKIILSNLDPLQYPAYYPLEKNEIISYQETWLCPGRTNGKVYCPNPRTPASIPSSAKDQK